jgi:hypothetical protein
MIQKIIYFYHKAHPVLVVVALLSVFHFFFDQITTSWFDDGMVMWLAVCATFLTVNYYGTKA